MQHKQKLMLSSGEKSQLKVYNQWIQTSK